MDVAGAEQEQSRRRDLARQRSRVSERVAYRRANGEMSSRTRSAATRDASSIHAHDLERMDSACSSCGAKFWIDERKPSSSKRAPLFMTCCGNGAFELPLFPNPPDSLLELLQASSNRAKHFRNNIRAFNSAFGFTSSGASYDRSLANNNSGVYTYRVQGAVYHLISDGLLPAEGEEPGFAQIYIYDTDYQLARRTRLFPDLDQDIVATITRALTDCRNPFVEQFTANSPDSLLGQSTQDFELRIGEPAQRNRQYDAPTGSEVAVLLLGAEDEGRGERSIVLKKRGGGLMYVNQLDSRYDPLHYVLLFPYGHRGWSLELKNRTGVTMNQFYRYHLMVRPTTRVLQLSGRLTQEYVVDAYAKIEESRLLWVRRNQATLRANLYQGLLDQVSGDDTSGTGRMIILPPSFTGGPRYMLALYQDAMAIVRKLGKPDLFITMTCNPNWPEITRELLPGQKAADRFDLCARVFQMKLKIMLDQIVTKEIFGKIKGRVYVVEFQKRGLPHAHMLWILEDEFKPRTTEDIDRFVCAEIPDIDEDPVLYACVTTHMIHGPCGAANLRSPCMKNNECSKKYPRPFVGETQLSSDGYPIYRRRNDGRAVKKGCHWLDNRSVVPYNKYLLKFFNCHINVEICSSIQSVKYLYKYVYKGHDRIQGRIVAGNEETVSRDEPKRYLDARYVSASEAFWRICEFNLQKMYPTVFALQVHDENMQSVTFRDDSSVGEILERSAKTTLTEWMRYNREHPDDEVARQTLYADFPSRYVWKIPQRMWSPRQQMQCIGRVHFVSPRDTTRYYLRLLLHHIPGATSFQDLRMVNGVLCETYQRAAYMRGLLDSDEEFDSDLRLAAASASPRQMRELFAMLLMFCEVSEPEILLERYMDDFSEDLRHDQGVDEVCDSIRRQTLCEIESILRQNGSSFTNFPSLPQDVELPESDVWGERPTNDIFPAMMEAERLSGMLNQDQRALYDAVMEAVELSEDDLQRPSARAFFIDGPGGSGKTFLYSAILAQMEASRKHVLSTATSGIAALLLKGGRTMHSTFKIPIPVNHLSTCNISPDSQIGRQILSASLIIVDEAPMMHRHNYEAMDRTMRDIMKSKDPQLAQVPFGGKVIVLGGDFRQMLPVIPRGTRSAVVNASLNRSELWSYFKVFKLSTNERVGPDQAAWCNFLLSVGEGRVDDVALPDAVQHAATLPRLIKDVYGNFTDDVCVMTSKTILTPLNEDVAKINEMVLDEFPGDDMVYHSSDTIPPGEVDNASLYPTEFLNTIDMASLPLHKLRLKIGCIVILLRNLNTPMGLCNGTRLRVDGFFPTMLQVTVVSQGAFYGNTHLLPRIALYPSQTRLPFSFKRLQFPVRLAFALTINKSQGQTLSTVGLYLPNPLFAHGQLYVALSRTRSGPAGIVFCDGGSGELTIRNVVYSEIF